MGVGVCVGVQTKRHRAQVAFKDRKIREEKLENPLDTERRPRDMTAKKGDPPSASPASASPASASPPSALGQCLLHSKEVSQSHESLLEKTGKRLGFDWGAVRTVSVCNWTETARGTHELYALFHCAVNHGLRPLPGPHSNPQTPDRLPFPCPRCRTTTCPAACPTARARVRESPWCRRAAYPSQWQNTPRHYHASSVRSVQCVQFSVLKDFF